MGFECHPEGTSSRGTKAEPTYMHIMLMWLMWWLNKAKLTRHPQHWVCWVSPATPAMPIISTSSTILSWKASTFSFGPSLVSYMSTQRSIHIKSSGFIHDNSGSTPPMHTSMLCGARTCEFNAINAVTHTNLSSGFHITVEIYVLGVSRMTSRVGTDELNTYNKLIFIYGSLGCC